MVLELASEGMGTRYTRTRRCSRWVTGPWTTSPSKAPTAPASSWQNRARAGCCPTTGAIRPTGRRSTACSVGWRGLQRGLPVATTSGVLTRFKVSDESFERRVLLAHGEDTLATLYLGSSPGLHHVHARTGKDDAVYAVGIAVYEAPDKAADREDKAILQFTPDSLENIEVAGLTPQSTPAAAGDKGTDKPAPTHQR